MNCRQANKLLKEYVSGDLDHDDLNNLKMHLEDCIECRNVFTQLKEIDLTFSYLPELEYPDPPVYHHRHYIEQEPYWLNRQNNPAGIYRRIIIPVSIAASILLFVTGFLAGKAVKKNDFKDQEITVLREEINDTKNLMVLNLIKQQSASKRIQAVNYAKDLEVLKPEVMDALFYLLNNDYSSNVKLASLEALSKYTENPLIRVELVKSFGNEKDPVIQLNMINLMVLLNEKSSAQIMQKLIEDESTTVTVKNQARKGLEVLL